MTRLGTNQILNCNGFAFEESDFLGFTSALFEHFLSQLLLWNVRIQARRNHREFFTVIVSIQNRLLAMRIIQLNWLDGFHCASQIENRDFFISHAHFIETGLPNNMLVNVLVLTVLQVAINNLVYNVFRHLAELISLVSVSLFGRFTQLSNLGTLSFLHNFLNNLRTSPLVPTEINTSLLNDSEFLNFNLEFVEQLS